MLAGAAWLIARHLGYEYTNPVFILNTLWWFPWLMFTAVPTPSITRKLEARLEAFNQAEQAYRPHPQPDEGDVITRDKLYAVASAPDR